MKLAEATTVALRPDAWLTQRLSRPCFTLASDALLDPDLPRVLQQARIFVTAKIPADRLDRIAALESLGFHVIETALSFVADDVASDAGDPRVRFAGAEDSVAVRRVAETSFRFSRFHLDPRIPNDVADRIKGDWAENYFRGDRGDGMVVAELDGKVAGFVQLAWSGPKLVIDLIAVAPHAARRGLARAMTRFAWTKGTGDDHRPVSMVVGTQAVNIPSCRLYEGMGFRLSAASIVMHHHGGEQHA